MIPTTAHRPHHPRRPGRRTWRAAVVVFLTVFLGGTGVVGAAALWSQSGTVQATVATGTWSTTGEDGGVAVTNGTRPISLASTLSFAEPQGAFRYDWGLNGLGFCHDFTVTNTSGGPVTWSVTLNTNAPPFWGLDPRTVAAKRTGVLRSFWGGQTTGYDASTGRWTIGGANYNRTLAAGATAQVGYCANPSVPEVNPRTFNQPIISVDPSSGKNSVALRVKVTSDYRFLVPWETEVDLADYVCASTLPDRINSEQAVLTRIEGTRYLLRGTGAYNQLVNSETSQDFVFARYNPGGKPFSLGSCP